MTGLCVQESPNGLRRAILSACGEYRYLLDIRLSLARAAKTVAFVMLNPSRADAMKDDPTLRRCISFARREGADRLRIVNLYAYRSPYPSDLAKVSDPVGPHCQRYLFETLCSADIVIAAWGANPAVANSRLVGDLACLSEESSRGRFYCLGFTAKGQPRHPLRLPAAAKLVPWPAQNQEAA